MTQQESQTTTTTAATTTRKKHRSIPTHWVYWAFFWCILGISVPHMAEVVQASFATAWYNTVLAYAFCAGVEIVIALAVISMYTARGKPHSGWMRMGLFCMIVALSAFSMYLQNIYNHANFQPGELRGAESVPGFGYLPWILAFMPLLNIFLALMSSVIGTPPAQDARTAEERKAQYDEEERVARVERDHARQMASIHAEKAGGTVQASVQGFMQGVGQSNPFAPRRKTGQQSGIALEEPLGEGEGERDPATNEQEEQGTQTQTQELPIFTYLQPYYDCPKGFSLGKPENVLDGQYTVITLKRAAREWALSETVLRQLADDESLREKYWFTLVKPGANAQYPTRMVDASQRSVIQSHLRSQSRSRPTGREEPAKKSTTKTSAAALASYTPTRQEEEAGQHNGHI